MTNQLTDQVRPIIEASQKEIWEAEYFISIDANAKYWSGRKDSSEFTLNAFRAVGISVFEVTSKMTKPDYSDLHGMVPALPLE